MDFLLLLSDWFQTGLIYYALLDLRRRSRASSADAEPDEFDSEPADFGAVETAAAAPAAAPASRVAILKHGCLHHLCAIDSPDYQEAFKTPGLVLRHPDGSIVEGVQ
jgi:zona occludens toxin (predicted ATPase)